MRSACWSSPAASVKMGRGDGPSIPIYFATESLRLYVKEGLILNIRLLTGDERFQARLISTVAFHMRMEDPDKAREESAQETIQDWGAFHEDGTLMAHVINHSFMSFLDGHLIRNGGIGGVSTLPEYRLNGCVREIFKSLLPCAYASGEVISTLYPFSHTFYRQFGYETVPWKNVYEFSPAVPKDYAFSGEARLWTPNDPVDPWMDLYNRFASSFNLSIHWDPQRTLNHLKGVYYQDRKFSYMLCEHGRPVAFLIFQDVRHDPQAILQVQQLAWDGARGFRAMLGFLARFSADYGMIRLFLPSSIELLSLIRSPLAYDIKKTTEHNYMIRVVNAFEALKSLRMPEDAAFTVRVEDGLIPENNGTWHVSAEGVVPSSQAPDLTVSEKALGQLVSGAVSLSEAVLREDTVLHGNQDTLSRIFVRKPILVEDFF